MKKITEKEIIQAQHKANQYNLPLNLSGIPENYSGSSTASVYGKLLDPDYLEVLKQKNLVEYNKNFPGPTDREKLIQSRSVSRGQGFLDEKARRLALDEAEDSARRAKIGGTFNYDVMIPKAEEAARKVKDLDYDSMYTDSLSTMQHNKSLKNKITQELEAISGMRSPWSSSVLHPEDVLSKLKLGKNIPSGLIKSSIIGALFDPFSEEVNAGEDDSVSKLLENAKPLKPKTGYDLLK